MHSTSRTTASTYSAPRQDVGDGQPRPETRIDQVATEILWFTPEIGQADLAAEESGWMMGDNEESQFSLFPELEHLSAEASEDLAPPVKRRRGGDYEAERKEAEGTLIQLLRDGGMPELTARALAATTLSVPEMELDRLPLTFRQQIATLLEKPAHRDQLALPQLQRLVTAGLSQLQHLALGGLDDEAFVYALCLHPPQNLLSITGVDGAISSTLLRVTQPSAHTIVELDVNASETDRPRPDFTDVSSFNQWLGSTRCLRSVNVAGRQNLVQVETLQILVANNPNLHRLDFSCTDLNDAGCQILAPLAPQLTHLCLDVTGISDSGLDLLINTKSPIERLRLPNRISANTLTQTLPRMGALCHLRVSLCANGSVLQALIAHLPQNLKSLELDASSDLDNEALHLLLQRCPQLEELSIDFAYDITTDAFRNARGLKRLQLWCGPLTDLHAFDAISQELKGAIPTLQHFIMFDEEYPTDPREITFD